MKLAKKLDLVDYEDRTVVEVLSNEYDKMADLQADMAKHPEKFEEGRKYTLVENKPFLSVIKTTAFTVEVVK